MQNFVGTNPDSKLLLLTDVAFPRMQLTFNEPDTFRGPVDIDAEEFIAVKGFKAKGKRLTTFALNEVIELEPTRFPEPEEIEEEETDIDEETDVEDEDSDVEEATENQDSEDSDDSKKPDDSEPKEKSEDEIRDELTGQLRLF